MKNFERNIKTKAEAFQMDPMPGTFDKVMDALEKKKKRRFIFWLWFIIPVFAIGATVSTYQIYSRRDHSAIAKNNTKETNLTRNEPSYSKNNNSPDSDNYSIVTTNNTNSNANLKRTDSENSTHSNPVVSTQKTEIKVEKNKSSNTNSITKKTDLILNDKKSSDIENNRREQSISITTTTNYSAVRFPLLVIPQTYSTFQKIPTATNTGALTKRNIPKVETRPTFYILPKRNKFSLGLYSDLGVSKSSFYTSIPFDSTTQGSYTNARSSADKFVFSYSAGIQFRYSPTRFLALETGIGFTHYESYQITTNGGVSPSSLVDQFEMDTVISLASYSSSYQESYNVYDYISIPLKLYYQKNWRVLGLEAGGGIIFDFPVNTKTYVANENTGISYLKKEVNGSRLNLFGIQAVANINLVCHIKEFSIFGGPTFKYRLNSMFDDSYIMQQRPYFIGGQIGVRYNF